MVDDVLTPVERVRQYREVDTELDSRIEDGPAARTYVVRVIGSGERYAWRWQLKPFADVPLTQLRLWITRPQNPWPQSSRPALAGPPSVFTEAAISGAMSDAGVNVEDAATAARVGDVATFIQAWAVDDDAEPTKWLLEGNVGARGTARADWFEQIVTAAWWGAFLLGGVAIWIFLRKAVR
jgi:hypothetical protein